VYYDAALATLVYRRAMDSQGASWGPAMQLDKRADGYQLAAVVDGRPAVIYGDRLSGHVMFRAANDALGTRWAAPSGLAPYGDLILSLEDRASLWATCSFADVGGRPALTFISRPQLTHYLWLAMHK
jgi:hypothetical protein